MPKVIKLYGPPGTGKTTALMRSMEIELDEGVDPGRIGYVAFTRKAAAEAISRLPIDPADMPWCRTLHSLAFRWLGLSRKDVMTPEHYKVFGEEFGYHFTGRKDELTGLFEPRGDNQMLNAIELARTRLTTIAEEAAKLGVEQPVWAIEQLAQRLREFKAREHLWDFTDMLEQMEDGPELDVLFVDEAQDLTPLQWRVVRILMRGCRRVYIAGDDDQAIYEWAGADVDEFLRFPGAELVLGRSYRIPSAVQEAAQKIVDGIGHRMPKDWKPRDAKGFVELGCELDQIDPAEGTWMFLARTHRQAGALQRYLVTSGRLFRTANGPSVKDEHMAAIRCWEALRRGEERPAALVRKALALVPGMSISDAVPDDSMVKHPVTEPWYEAMTRLGREQIEYIRRCLANGEREPRCYVGTIHSVKGGEADYVVLCPDVPARAELFTDAERRVWYVAMTRARRGVYVLRPLRNLNVSILI